jgi:hypothetical protein
LHSIDVGYRLHHAVIYLMQRSIGTVWVAGTYNEAAAERATPGFKVPVCVAYGEFSTAKEMVDRFMSWAAGSANRLPLPQIAFDAANGRPFTDENPGDKLAFSCDFWFCC